MPWQNREPTMKQVIPFGSDATVGTVPSRPDHKLTVGLERTWENDTQSQLQLLQRLIGRTDRDSLLEHFLDWARDLGLADGLTFADANDEVCTLGNRRHHSARYEITIEGQKVGTLHICRRERYSESELIVIEQAIGNLARSLRSAAEVAELKRSVRSDSLTGLGNRPSLDEWLQRELARAARHGSPLSVMMIDVDHFKHLNDTLGHLNGDRILQAIAGVLAGSTRASDHAFRYGGDEFTLILPHTDQAGAELAARQIRASLARIPAQELGLTPEHGALRPDVSVGIATYCEGDDRDSLLKRADGMLYEAKAGGRGRACA